MKCKGELQIYITLGKQQFCLENKLPNIIISRCFLLNAVLMPHNKNVGDKGYFHCSSLPCIRQSVGLLFEDNRLHRIKKKKKKTVSAQVYTSSKDFGAKRTNLHLEQTVGYC